MLLPDKSLFGDETNCQNLCPDLTLSHLYFLLSHFQPSFDHCTMELRQAVSPQVLKKLKKRGVIMEKIEDLLI